MDYFEANTIHYEGLTNNPPILWAIFLSGLAITLLFSFLFEKMNINSIAGGFKYGAIIYFLFSLSMALYFYAAMNYYSGTTIMVVDVLASTVYGGLTGAVIGAILGRGQAKQNS